MKARIAFGGLLVLVGLATCAALMTPARPARSAPGEMIAAATLHAEHPGEPCALFAPGTPWEVVQRVSQAMIDQAEPSLRFQEINVGSEGNPWFSFGTSGRSLKYSFVPDGVFLPSGFAGDVGSNNVLNARMTTLFGAGNTAVWKGLFAQCFARWSQITGITYTLVNDDGAAWGSAGGSTRGDIRIAMRNIDGVQGILAFNQYPTNGDMILDSSENWANSTNNYRFLRNTVMHEHGHGLGLKHVCPIDQTKLMEPFLNIFFDGPQHDDIRGGQDLYGDRFEPNPSTASPALLGFIPQGSAVDLDELSIRNSSDADVFSFTLSANSRISVTVSPVGLTYNQGPQNADGSCVPGTPFDSTNISDLQFSLINSAFATLVTANATPFRGSEQIVNFPLTAAGFYYIKVSSFAQNGTDQVYSLNISVRSAATPCPADLNADGVVNSTDLSLLLGHWGTGPNVADINADGIVNSTDLSLLLGGWGACP